LIGVEVAEILLQAGIEVHFIIREIIVILQSDSRRRSSLAAVMPAIPFPIIIKCIGL